MSYEYENKRIRREAKRERKREEKLELAERKRKKHKKARRCLICGRWIKKYELMYHGVIQGEAYIHISTANIEKMSDSQKEAIMNHEAIPREIPTKL